MFERCLYFNVNALARAVNRIWDEAFVDMDLPPSHAYLLRAVLAEPGSSQKALAAKLKLEKSTVTRFVNSLQEKGLVKRSKSGTEDNREQRIFPTQKATRIREALEKKSGDLYQKMTACLGETELKTLVLRLRETIRALK